MRTCFGWPNSGAGGFSLEMAQAVSVLLESFWQLNKLDVEQQLDGLIRMVLLIVPGLLDLYMAHHRELSLTSGPHDCKVSCHLVPSLCMVLVLLLQGHLFFKMINVHINLWTKGECNIRLHPHQCHGWIQCKWKRWAFVHTYPSSKFCWILFTSFECYSAVYFC